jgi:hypothetical protein
LKTRSRPENEKPGNEKLNSRFKPGKNLFKPGNGHFQSTLIGPVYLGSLKQLLV